jgi:D-arabinose 1-dehydrogenase-like Zn-dependent alcohol dehydrogenase
MVTSGKLAVYEAPGKPFELRSYPIRAPRAGEALVKVRMSTICRSDIHSYLGHRPNPCPGVLGHEIIGDVVALGDGITHDMRGGALAAGDRVTWSEYFVPRRGARRSSCRRRPRAWTSTATWQ